MSSFAEGLLPGLDDNVTLAHIASKLSWTTFHVLVSVSRNWHRAIQSRRVYNERIRLETIETLAVVKHRHDSCHGTAISLYSLRERTFYQLPPVPRPRGISGYSQFISSNGTLYVMGEDGDCYCSVCTNVWTEQTGSMTSVQDDRTADRDTRMYMLDLAGHGKWKECDSIPRLQLPRDRSTIRCATRMENEYFMRSGSPRWFMSSWVKYDRVGHKWSPVEASQAIILDKYSQRRLRAEGKHYKIKASSDCHNIYHYDKMTKRTTHQHFIPDVLESRQDGTISYPVSYPHKITPLFILPVNNELFAIARCTTVIGDGYCLIQSRGFGSKSKEIVWEKVPHPYHFLNGRSTFAMCPIQL